MKYFEKNFSKENEKQPTVKSYFDFISAQEILNKCNTWGREGNENIRDIARLCGIEKNRCNAPWSEISATIMNEVQRKIELCSSFNKVILNDWEEIISEFKAEFRRLSLIKTQPSLSIMVSDPVISRLAELPDPLKYSGFRYEPLRKIIFLEAENYDKMVFAHELSHAYSDNGDGQIGFRSIDKNGEYQKGCSWWDEAVAVHFEKMIPNTRLKNDGLYESYYVTAKLVCEEIGLPWDIVVRAHQGENEARKSMENILNMYGVTLYELDELYFGYDQEVMNIPIKLILKKPLNTQEDIFLKKYIQRNPTQNSIVKRMYEALSQSKDI